MTENAGRLRPSTDVQGKDLGSEYMFYDKNGDDVHVLNETAREIFLLCDGSRTETEVVREMVEQFEADEETVRKDVTTIIEKLLSLNLLTAA